MKNLSLNAKFVFILSIFVLASAVVSTLAILKINELNGSISTIVSSNVPRTLGLTQLARDMTEIANLEKALLIENRPEAMKVMATDIDKLIKDVDAKMDETLKILVKEESKAELREAIKTFEIWKGFHAKLRELTLADKNDLASAIALGDSRANLQKIDALLSPSITRNSELLRIEAERAEAIYEASRNLIIGVSFSAIFTGLLLAFFILRSLNKTIDQVINGLNDNSNQVTSAAQQIAASSQQLSQGATEQASSLEETSSAVEEMNSMVQKNSENAQHSSKSSQTSGESANRGKQVVEEMKRAMTDIDSANNDIMVQTTESNVKFSEIVKVIAEIGNKTKVINDIVFQTKLLSFNASVEAARAGEHGKGFAVVAEEVGNLAQMSGNAAKEISSMLDSSILKVEDIVRETKSSVEKLTRESKLKVEIGTKVAIDCGHVLDEIVSKVTLVSQMSQSISTASEEQARGILEITKAVTQLDQMTQQNAAASEETASAAEELSAQAESMQSVVQTLIQTIKGGDPTLTPVVHSRSQRPVSKIPTNRTSNGQVIHMGGNKAKSARPLDTMKSEQRMVVGSDIIPSQDDSRFKDI